MSQGWNDGKEMYEIAWCTCKFVVLSTKTFYLFAVLLCRWFCCHPEIVLPWWRDVILLLFLRNASVWAYLLTGDSISRGMVDWRNDGTKWRNTRNILNTEYTEFTKTRSLQNIVKQNTEYMEYSKTKKKRKIFQKGYTCMQSTPITRTLATDSNLTLTRSNTNFCFSSDHFYIILPSITRTMF